MKGKTFVSINESIIYKYPLELKRRLLGWLAPILDSPKTEYVTRLIVNISFTSLVLAGVVFLFEGTHPLRYGFGIAVTIVVVQHYFQWVLAQL